LGFTGTSKGMTEAQKRMLVYFLEPLEGEFHFGDDAGADKEAAEIARKLGYRLISHPPVNAFHRAFVPSNVEYPPLPFLVRNKAIVAATQILIAAPKTVGEVLRSGTWATVRYARKMNRKIIMLNP